MITLLLMIFFMIMMLSVVIEIFFGMVKLAWAMRYVIFFVFVLFLIGAL